MFENNPRGDTKRILEQLGVYGEHYDRAWDLLDQRYSNRRALIENEIQTLMDLPLVSPKDPSTVGRALDTMRSVEGWV